MRTYTFELEGKSYTLKFDYNAICDMEELTGKPIHVLFSEENVGLSTVRTLLWAGLKWKNAGITKQQVGFMVSKMVEEKIYDEVVNKAIQLLVKSMPTSESVEQDVGE